MKKKANKVFTLVSVLVLSLNIGLGVLDSFSNVTSAHADTVTTTPPVTNQDLDETLNKTQQWLNKVSDSIKDTGVTITGAEQEKNGDFTVSAQETLKEDYSAIIQTTFNTNGIDATLKVTLLRDEQAVAFQSMTGKMEKSGNDTLFTYTDSNTNKETTINLTSGHASSAAATAIPLAFTTIGSVAEVGGISVAMTAALPAILILGGATLLVSGGYMIYTETNAENQYSSAAESRADAAFNKMGEFSIPLDKAINLGNVADVSKNLNALTSYQTALNTNMKMLNATASALNQATIGISQGLNTLNQSIASVNQNLSKINSSIGATTQTINEMTQEVTSINESISSMNQGLDMMTQAIATMNQGLSQLKNTLSQIPLTYNIPQSSALPTFTEVTYDKTKNVLTLAGSMPTASTIDIYINHLKTTTTATAASGSFTLTIPITADQMSNEGVTQVTIDAIQNSTSSTTYTSSNITKPYGSPTFNILANGTVAADDVAKPLVKTTILDSKVSALPTFTTVSYNKLTNQLHVVGKMPTASKIEVYSRKDFYLSASNLIGTSSTLSNGNFDMEVSVDAQNPVVSFEMIQNATSNIVYLSQKDGNTFSMNPLPEFIVYPGGTVVRDGYNTNSPTLTPLPALASTAAPKAIGAVSYNDQTKVLSLPITMATASTVTVYKNGVKCETVKTDSSGKVNLSTTIEGTRAVLVTLKILQNNTSSTFYDPNLPQTLTFYRGEDGQISEDATTILKLFPTKTYNDVKNIPNYSVTPAPLFANVSFDKTTNILSLGAICLTLFSNSTTLDVYVNKIKTQSIKVGSWTPANLKIPIQQGVDTTIGFDVQADSNAQNIFSPYFYQTDYSMFTVDASGNVSVDSTTQKMLHITDMVTPIPNVSPIPVGKGVTLQGNAMPQSDVIVKNKGIEYNGKANDKGYFEIPLPEVDKDDAIEIFVTAPNTITYQYSQSNAVSVKPINIDDSTIYSPADMGVADSTKFSDDVAIENGELTSNSIRNLASLADVNVNSGTVTLGPYIDQSTSSYDQVAYRKGNTFFSMGANGWTAIVDKLKEAGITDPDDIRNEMWKINEKFLDYQISEAKNFEFTGDPTTLRKDSFGYMEYDYLLSKDYQLINDNGQYRMEK